MADKAKASRVSLTGVCEEEELLAKEEVLLGSAIPSALCGLSCVLGQPEAAGASTLEPQTRFDSSAGEMTNPVIQSLSSRSSWC